MSEEDSIYEIADKRPVPVVIKKSYECGGCGRGVMTTWFYCPYCGRKLIWKNYGDQ